MNRNEVKDMLSEIEEYFFYKENNPRDLWKYSSRIEEIRGHVVAALTMWHCILKESEESNK